MGLLGQLKHAWNVFQTIEEKPEYISPGIGTSYGGRPDRVRLSVSNERTLLASIFTKIAVEASGIEIRHCQLDDQGRLKSFRQSGLDNCLTVEANLDQGARAAIQDAFLTLFDEGVIAIVPVDTTLSPNVSSGYDIQSYRVGRIKQWFPERVKVELYNEKTGKYEDVIVDKRYAAIVENPFYTVMNEPNSTLQRLLRKLAFLDRTDEMNSSGKLDLLIQLPYTIRTDNKRQQAEVRRADIERQLREGQYGIAYIDGTEKVTQLNRPTENKLIEQISDLKKDLYSQLGVSESVMDGTADEATMLNYYNRTIEPLLDALVQAMRRSFLTKTARTQGQTIMYFRDPFKLVPLSTIGDIADKFSRNEIMSANEIRSKVGLAPDPDPKSDKLMNSNMPQPPAAGTTPAPSGQDVPPSQKQEGTGQNGA